MKKLRQSVIVDESKYNNNSRVKDKTKSRIFTKSIKEEEDFNKSGINKKKSQIKEIPEYPIEPSSQRTDKNLLLKQNKSKKSTEKLVKVDTKKDKSKKDLNIIETTGMNNEEEKKENSLSSWEEDSGEEINSEDV